MLHDVIMQMVYAPAPHQFLACLSFLARVVVVCTLKSNVFQSPVTMLKYFHQLFFDHTAMHSASSLFSNFVTGGRKWQFLHQAGMSPEQPDLFFPGVFPGSLVVGFTSQHIGTLPSSIPSSLYFCLLTPTVLSLSDEAIWRNVMFSIKSTH